MIDKSAPPDAKGPSEQPTRREFIQLVGAATQAPTLSELNAMVPTKEMIASANRLFGLPELYTLFEGIDQHFCMLYDYFELSNIRELFRSGQSKAAADAFAAHIRSEKPFVELQIKQRLLQAKSIRTAMDNPVLWDRLSEEEKTLAKPSLEPLEDFPNVTLQKRQSLSALIIETLKTKTPLAQKLLSDAAVDTIPEYIDDWLEHDLTEFLEQSTLEPVDFEHTMSQYAAECMSKTFGGMMPKQDYIRLGLDKEIGPYEKIQEEVGVAIKDRQLQAHKNIDQALSVPYIKIERRPRHDKRNLSYGIVESYHLQIRDDLIGEDEINGYNYMRHFSTALSSFLGVSLIESDRLKSFGVMISKDGAELTIIDPPLQLKHLLDEAIAQRANVQR